MQGGQRAFFLSGFLGHTDLGRSRVCYKKGKSAPSAVWDNREIETEPSEIASNLGRSGAVCMDSVATHASSAGDHTGGVQCVLCGKSALSIKGGQPDCGHTPHADERSAQGISIGALQALLRASLILSVLRVG